MINCNRNFGLQNFPFLEDDFDATTDYKLFSKMVGHVERLEKFIKDELDGAIRRYINEEFNNMMLDAMYDAETETLILYLTRDGGNN